MPAQDCDARVRFCQGAGPRPLKRPPPRDKYRAAVPKRRRGCRGPGWTSNLPVSGHNEGFHSTVAGLRMDHEGHIGRNRSRQTHEQGNRKSRHSHPRSHPINAERETRHRGQELRGALRGQKAMTMMGGNLQTRRVSKGHQQQACGRGLRSPRVSAAVSSTYVGAATRRVSDSPSMIGSYATFQHKQLHVPPMPTLRRSSCRGPSRPPTEAQTARPCTRPMTPCRSHGGRPQPSSTLPSHATERRSNTFAWSAKNTAGTWEDGMQSSPRGWWEAFDKSSAATFLTWGQGRKRFYEVTLEKLAASLASNFASQARSRHKLFHKLTREESISEIEKVTLDVGRRI